MATRRTRSAIGYGAGARPADGRLPLRPACGVGNVKGMQDLGAPRAGSSARSAPLPIAPFEKRQSRLGRWFDNWLRSVGMAVILFVIIKTFLVEAFQIPSGSMERTLLAGDFLFVNKAVYGAQIPGTKARLPGFESPRRGDVIVFAYPKNPELNYVKRVIGLPGDTVEMRGGEVRVNGDPLAERYVQRVDPGHDVYDPEFNWQRDYLLGGASVARNYRSEEGRVGKEGRTRGWAGERKREC